MGSRLVRTQDGILVEAVVSGEEAYDIAGQPVKQVEGTLNELQPLLLKLCRPFVETWRELNKDMLVDAAEVEVGLAFEGEGNLYVTRVKGNANITVRLTLRPSPPDVPKKVPPFDGD